MRVPTRQMVLFRPPRSAGGLAGCSAGRLSAPLRNELAAEPAAEQPASRRRYTAIGNVRL